MLCSWRLCSSPGMYAVTSLPLLSRTRAIFRRAELGFLGVMVLTWRQTPRFCGEASRSLTLLIRGKARRGFLINWLIVGIGFLRSRSMPRAGPAFVRAMGGAHRRERATDRRAGLLFGSTCRAGGNPAARGRKAGEYMEANPR